MRTNLWDDPRVAAVCDRLEVSEATAVGALYRLWAIADEHSEDGTLPAITAASLDRKVGVKGFAEAVAGVGWLAINDGFIVIERFEEHNGKSAKKRSLDARRKGSARKADKVRTESGHDADESRTDRGQKAPNCGTRPRPSTRPKEETSNEVSTSQPEPATRKFSSSEWDQKFSRRMFADISSIVPSAKRPSFDAWANEVRLMRESDHRTEAEIESLWSWTSRDSFWQANVLSPKKFREKWPQLCAKRDAQSRAGPPRATQDKFAGNREFLERMAAKNAPGSVQSTNGTTHGGNGQRLLE